MKAVSDRFNNAVSRLDEAHAEDPRRVDRNGREIAWSVLYHDRMRAWLTKLAPDASEALRLAVYSQHLRRWKIPRDRYPEGKLGYKAWRRELAILHGDEAAVILRECGYGEDVIERVRELLLKTQLKTDPETQTLEDVACLVFLENEFEDFASKHEPEKLAVILRKTWKKMSPRGREEALALAEQLPEDLRKIVVGAVAEEI